MIFDLMADIAFSEWFFDHLSETNKAMFEDLQDNTNIVLENGLEYTIENGVYGVQDLTQKFARMISF